MEAELLRGMIVDRDVRIAKIQQKQKDLDVREERLKDDLAEAAELNSSQIMTQQTEKTALFHQHQAILHQLENLISHLHRQGESLNEYIMYIQQMGDISADDTQNVMRLQAQLCKGMHSMSIVDRQVEFFKEQNEKIMKFQKEQLVKQSEDKANLERSILNDLMERDTEVRNVENEWKKQLDVILREMNAIRDQLDDDDSEDEKDEDDVKPKESDDDEVMDEEDLDDEEKAAKQEMMKILQERREEIQRLEKEIEEREELIEELQMRVEDERLSGESPVMAARKEFDPEGRPSNQKKKNDDEEDEDGNNTASQKEVPKRQEEPVDEIAARLEQVMASASNVKVDVDVDEMDLLKLAQSRLTGGGNVSGDQDEEGSDVDDDEEDSEEEEDTEFDEDFSEGVDGSENGPVVEAGKAVEEEFDPTEKKEDPLIES